MPHSSCVEMATIPDEIWNLMSNGQRTSHLKRVCFSLNVYERMPKNSYRITSVSHDMFVMPVSPHAFSKEQIQWFMQTQDHLILPGQGVRIGRKNKLFVPKRAHDGTLVQKDQYPFVMKAPPADARQYRDVDWDRIVCVWDNQVGSGEEHRYFLAFKDVQTHADVCVVLVHA